MGTYHASARGRTSRGLRNLGLLVLSTGSGACVAPFADFQSAHTVPQGQVELTGSYSYVQFAEGGEREKIQDEFGLQAAWGVGERAELRTRYHLVRVEGESFSSLALGPKFGISPGRAAVYLPLGLGFGSDVDVSETLAFQPTFLATFPATPSFEVTASAKAHLWLNQDDADSLLAFNLGFGIGPDVRRWAFRPEIGLMINPGEDGAAWQFGLGFSSTLGDRP